MLKEIEIRNINHLGIVAGIIDKLDIVNIINQELGRDEQEIVNSGEIVSILNSSEFKTSEIPGYSWLEKERVVM